MDNRKSIKSGIINVYKEAGYTSHDVVAKMRGILGMKKIGHTGTLDPDATGVLPVCIGKATKVCELLTGEDKTYRCVMLLGQCTDTQDASGCVLSECPVNLTEKAVEEAARSFLGAYDQVPPMYSALKVQGKKLYELARAGKEVERAPRRVMIHRLEVISIDLPRVVMEVTCSRGTYIRTLCHDIGSKLGCGACMERLERTRVAGFSMEESHRLSELEAAVREGTIDQWVIPVDWLFSDCPEATVREEYQKALDNGNRLPLAALFGRNGQDGPEQVRLYDGQDGPKQVRLYDSAGRFVGLYQYQKREADFKPVKIFYEKE